MADTHQPKGEMVDIPRTSEYFAQVQGYRPDPNQVPQHGHITGRPSGG